MPSVGWEQKYVLFHLIPCLASHQILLSIPQVVYLLMYLQQQTEYIRTTSLDWWSLATQKALRNKISDSRWPG